MGPRTNINGPLAWSLLLLAVAAITLLITVPSLLVAALAPGPGDEGVNATFASLIEDHAADLTQYRARFDGRSIFFKPKQPPPPVTYRPPPPPPPPTDLKPAAPPPPPGPTVAPPYRGPAVEAAIGDEVWFTGELRVAVNETLNGLTVVAVNLPWSVDVKYGGWPYTLDIFPKSEIFTTPEEEKERTAAATLPGLLEPGQEPPPPPVVTPATESPRAADEEPPPPAQPEDDDVEIPPE